MRGCFHTHIQDPEAAIGSSAALRWREGPRSHTERDYGMGMKIGALARFTGARIETIRYYERAGLLPAPPRTGGNYRIYGDEHVARLTFIRHCRVLDMALDDVRRLLMVKDASGANCGTVNRLLDDHIVRIRERIETLQGLETALQQLREQCPDPRAVEDCGILNELSEPPGVGCLVGQSTAELSLPQGFPTTGSGCPVFR